MTAAHLQAGAEVVIAIIALGAVVKWVSAVCRRYVYRVAHETYKPMVDSLVKDNVAQNKENQDRFNDRLDKLMATAQKQDQIGTRVTAVNIACTVLVFLCAIKFLFKGKTS